MHEYEVYWLTDFHLYLLSAHQKNNHGDLKKSKQTSTRKNSNFTVDRDHSYKK